jgi:hypothetical protein
MLTAHSFRRVGVATVVLYAALVLSFIVSGRALPGSSVVEAASGPTAAQWSCAGTKFYNSAGLGATFTTGSTHNGGTFAVENNNTITVLNNPASGGLGYIVGEFNSPKINGDDATITFNRTIRIVSVYVWDNDPATTAGETGWSFMGNALPLTGHQASTVVAVDYTTNTVRYSAGKDSGGIDFCYVEVNGGGEGCTPGYWKNHRAAWAGTGYSTSQLVSSVFSGANPGQASATLLQALSFGGGPGVDGAEKILLRAAVASLLNASHPSVDFEMSASQVISQVSAALASNNRATILALATTLDDANNADEGCPLN